jgi:hypothetical protein
MARRDQTPGHFNERKLTMPKHITSPEKSCNFPATSLRAYRKELAEKLRNLIDSAFDTSRAEYIIRSIAAIDDLRFNHEQTNHCLCWYAPAQIAWIRREQTAKGAKA